MKFKLVILPEFEDDTHRASSWYDRESKALGTRFLRESYAALRRIGRNPMIFRLLEDGYRRANMPNFPYSIFYFLDQERVVAAAIFHSSRDPAILRDILDARKEQR